MMTLWNTTRGLKIWTDSRGQDLAEYALIGGFIAVAGVIVFPSLGSDMLAIFAKIVVQLQNTDGGTSSPAA